MDGAGVAAMHPREGAAQAVPVPGRQDQVHMVGHQAPSPDLDPGGAAFAAQQVAIERVILLGKEGLLPAVAALGHVMRTAGHDDPGEACHARSVAGF